MKTRHIFISALALFLVGILITMLSFETVSSAPPENLPNYMTPIPAEVGKTTTPIGIYMIVTGIAVMIGTGIYCIIIFTKKRIRQ